MKRFLNILIVVMFLMSTLPVRPAAAISCLYTVLNNKDSGEGSLRQALLGTCDIGFDPTLSEATILLGTTLTINRNVTIDGSNLASKVTISGGRTVKVLEVSSGVTATLNSLIITNGNLVSGGGGIDNAGNLTILNSVISNNSVTNQGGGIFNAGGTLTITDSILQKNMATQAGGGILNMGNGTVTLTNSTLSQNSSLTGGGIYSDSGTVTLTGTTLSANTANGTTGNGGGILSMGTLILETSTLSGNTAVNQGGGIFNLGGILTITNSTMESNSAKYGAGIAKQDGTLTVNNSTLASNIASSIGGGIYNAGSGAVTVTNSTFSLNQANGGGGVFNGGGSLTVTGSTLSGNISSGSNGQGGGFLNNPGQNMTVANSTLVGNSASQGGGGISNFGTLTLLNSTLSGNYAYSSAMGHGLYNYNGATLNYANTIIANSPLSLGDCVNLSTIGTNTNNLVEDESCSATLSDDPMLDILANNSGPTQTMALMAGSPAIDAGDDATCTAPLVSGLDQRGMSRLKGSHCDIGAYEFGLGIMPLTLPVGEVGVQLSQQLTVEGGVEPYNWWTSNSGLPNGFGIGNTTGLFSGTSWDAGTFSFTAVVYDSSGLTGERNYSLTIHPALTFIPSDLPIARLNTVYYQEVSVSGRTDETPVLTLDSGTLPTGITFNGTAFTGTPTAIGTSSNIVIKATYTDGLVKTKTYTLSVIGEHVFTWDTSELLEGSYTTFTAITGFNNHYWTRGSQPGELCNMAVSYSYTSPMDIWFDASGEYQVCLSMYDSNNLEVTDSQWVTITNVKPTNIDLHSYPQPAFPGSEITMYGYFNDYQDAPYSILVDWGDGVTNTFTTDDTYIPGSYHTYTEVGEYTIQVSVTDKDNATATGSTTQYISMLMVEPDGMWMASDTDPTTIELLGYGIPTGTVSFSIASTPAYGSFDTPSAPECKPIDMPNAPVGVVACKATVIYTPSGIPAGGTETWFTYTISDGTYTSPAGQIDLYVGPNSAPSATSGSAIVSSVSPSYVFLTSTDPDIYGYYNDRITVNIFDQPQNGTLGPVGMPSCVDYTDPDTEDIVKLCTSAVLYTPTPDTSATTDSISFFVNDSHQNSNTATVSLSLHAPVTWHVNSTDSGGGGPCDETHCTLREALDAAMVGDNIDFTFTLPATITLGGEQHIRIDKSVNIIGPGAQLLSISGAESSQVFEFFNFDQPMRASISGLTIRDGRGGSGGGLYLGEHAEVTVTDCVIGPNNIVTYAGGGIANIGGILTLNRSTVVENHGTGTLGGAGIVTTNNGSTTIINSTVTGNVTNNYGGGILAAYGGKVNLIHSTVTGNTANANYETEAWGGGGGIAIIDDGSVSILNSIVAGNSDLTDPVTANHPAWPDVSGTFNTQQDGTNISGIFNSLGGNLIGDSTGSNGWIASDLVGTDPAPINPLFGPYGPHDPGTTPTYSLLISSPAVNAVSCPDEITTDQRGVTRPQGSACDIGAFELVLGELMISKVFDPLTSGFTGTFSISYDCDDGTTNDGTVNLAEGASTTISNIPIGTVCAISEPALPTPPTGWTFGAPAFNPLTGSVTISDTIVEVIVTNAISHDVAPSYNIFLPLVLR